MTSKRVFVSFPAPDTRLRDFLVGQAYHDRSPFEFVDYTVKEPWDNLWKTNCRTRICGCDALIAIITANTPKASRQLWEIGCALDAQIPVLMVYGYTTDRPPRLPEPIDGRNILTWSWNDIASFLERV